MNVSVDDLVASFNSSHIGQEAIDLAALQVRLPPLHSPFFTSFPHPPRTPPQAQLSQTLFAQSMSSPFTPHQRGAPLNSPIARTPSASISLDPSEAAWLRHNSMAATKMRCSIDEGQHEATDDMDEDERMVEDLLLASPASPTQSAPSFLRAPQSPSAAQASASTSYHRPRKTSLSVHMIPLDHAAHELPAANTSLFATTDPFYLASLQNHAPASASVFAQAGRPAAHSPFMHHHHHHHHHHMQYSAFGHHPFHQNLAPDAQPHMFATAAAFSS